jgi:hypothetical protein
MKAILFSILLFVVPNAFAEEAAPILSYNVVAKGTGYTPRAQVALFDVTIPELQLEQDKTPPPNAKQWFEQEAILTPQYRLLSKLIQFEKGYWRLDFEIVRYEQVPGGEMYVPVCTASQLFASVEQMELLKTTEMTCWGTQFDPSVHPTEEFTLSVFAN